MLYVPVHIKQTLHDGLVESGFDVLKLRGVLLSMVADEPPLPIDDDDWFLHYLFLQLISDFAFLLPEDK